jgi:hypothetical protein
MTLVTTMHIETSFIDTPYLLQMFVCVFPLGIPPYVPVRLQPSYPALQAAVLPPRLMHPSRSAVQLERHAASAAGTTNSTATVAAAQIPIA